MQHRDARTTAPKIPWSQGLTLLRRFWPTLRPQNRLAAAIGLLLLLAIPSGVVSPFLVKRLFDDALPAHDLRALITYGLLIAAFTVLSATLNYFEAILTIRLRNRVRFRITSELFEHLLRLPLRFTQRTETGYLMSRLRDDVAALDSLMTDTLVVAVIDLLRAVLFCSLLLYLDTGLALSGLVLVGVIFAGVAAVAPALRRRSAAAREADALSSAGLHEALTGLYTVRTTAQEPHERRRFGLTVMKALRAAARRDVLGTMTDSAIGLAGVLGAYVIVAVGAYRIMTGQSTVGSLFAFFIFLSHLTGAAGSVLGLVPRVQKGLASLQRIFELLDEPAETHRGDTAGLPARLRGEVQIENLSFSYDSQNWALQDVTLHVHPGEVLALVGRSGAGKSTLVHLLPRLYPVERGRILIDGRPLEACPLRWLRRQIGVVPQDIFLFDRTIRENIVYACPEASEAALEHAARSAHASEFIARLPMGYDTIVGERGVRLSGGEKQRLAIAREILRDPAILILDEATSNLDAESEQLIRDALQHLMRGRTCFVIAHRLSTVRGASRIVVLDGGHIVEEGTHAELLERGGLYRELHDRQMIETPAVVRET
ncbi:MAG: ABC transporter ATP-binding protein [Planctomycetota bacterium]